MGDVAHFIGCSQSGLLLYLIKMAAKCLKKVDYLIENSANNSFVQVAGNAIPHHPPQQHHKEPSRRAIGFQEYYTR